MMLSLVVESQGQLMQPSDRKEHSHPACPALPEGPEGGPGEAGLRGVHVDQVRPQR